MDFELIMNEEVVNKIIQCIKKSAFEAIQDMRIDIDQAQTVPFRDGTLNDSAHVVFNGLTAELRYSTPYALVQYYVPMRHYRGQHSHATDHWMDPYIPGRGNKGDFIARQASIHLAANMREEFGDND